MKSVVVNQKNLLPVVLPQRYHYQDVLFAESYLLNIFYEMFHSVYYGKSLEKCDLRIRRHSIYCLINKIVETMVKYLIFDEGFDFSDFVKNITLLKKLNEISAYSCEFELQSNKSLSISEKSDLEKEKEEYTRYIFYLEIVLKYLRAIN